MNCHICKSPAKFIRPAGDYDHVICQNCGEYKIAGTALAMAATRKIDTTAMQQWFDNKRNAGEKVPMISSMELMYT